MGIWFLSLCLFCMVFLLGYIIEALVQKGLAAAWGFTFSPNLSLLEGKTTEVLSPTSGIVFRIHHCILVASFDSGHVLPSQEARAKYTAVNMGERRGKCKHLIRRGK